MALTATEQLETRVQQFHQLIRGHRRAPWWPDVPRAQVNLAVCESPVEHEWDDPVTVKLAKRPYGLTVTVCKKCPMHLSDVVLTQGGKT